MNLQHCFLLDHTCRVNIKIHLSKIQTSTPSVYNTAFPLHFPVQAMLNEPWCVKSVECPFNCTPSWLHVLYIILTKNLIWFWWCWRCLWEFTWISLIDRLVYSEITHRFSSWPSAHQTMGNITRNFFQVSTVRTKPASSIFSWGNFKHFIIAVFVGISSTGLEDDDEDRLLLANFSTINISWWQQKVQRVGRGRVFSNDVKEVVLRDKLRKMLLSSFCASPGCFQTSLFALKVSMVFFSFFLFCSYEVLSSSLGLSFSCSLFSRSSWCCPFVSFLAPLSCFFCFRGCVSCFLACCGGPWWWC